ncbi:MAG: hypothetical protein ACPGRX_02390 [Bdellovibrionales bacterium]
MKKTVMITAAMAAMVVGFGAPVEAREQREYCKTFTKSMVSHGNRHTGYAKACRVDRDVWEITRLSGSFLVREALRDMIYSSLNSRSTRYVTLIDPYARSYAYRDRHYDERPWRYRDEYNSAYRTPVYREDGGHGDKHKSRR